MDTTGIVAFPLSAWDQPCHPEQQRQALQALESGSVLLFPQLRFPIEAGEERLLSAAAAGRAKNVSFDPGSGALRGSGAAEAELAPLRAMMKRFSELGAGLIRNLLPRYAAGLRPGRTSYRPVEIAGRSTSWRKDDARLHVDSFPATPTHGERILRVFANVNPRGHARTWRLGEPFEAVARRYARSLPGPLPGAGLALAWLRVTKTRRSAYDHYMLRLHDRMKADLEYQMQAPQRRFEFQPGSAWIVFTDQVSHAAMNGQYALEQTFHLPVDAMLEPSRSPLRVLERVLGRTLA